MTKWMTEIGIDTGSSIGYNAYGYNAYMKEIEMTEKKSPRPALNKPRKVVINPVPSKEAIVLTENLVPLQDIVVDLGTDVLSEIGDGEYSLQSRDEGGNDPITPYGLFLGTVDNGSFIPEVIIDEGGCYVLIFHNIKK